MKTVLILILMLPLAAFFGGMAQTAFARRARNLRGLITVIIYIIGTLVAFNLFG